MADLTPLDLSEGGWQIVWWGARRPAFFDPRGGTHYEGRWEPPALPRGPVAAMTDTQVRMVLVPQTDKPTSPGIAPWSCRCPSISRSASAPPMA